MMRFIDVNGDDDLDLEEIEDAFRRAKMNKYFEQLSFNEAVLWILDAYLKKRQQTFTEFFREIDIDHSGSLSCEEICVEFHKLGTWGGGTGA